VYCSFDESVRVLRACDKFSYCRSYFGMLPLYKKEIQLFTCLTRGIVAREESSDHRCRNIRSAVYSSLYATFGQRVYSASPSHCHGAWMEMKFGVVDMHWLVCQHQTLLY
jgi:hypothetical protein